MIKNRLNKKKISTNSIVRPSAFIISILVLIFIFYEVYKSNVIKKIFVDKIEKFSQNYGYSFTKVNIN